MFVTNIGRRNHVVEHDLIGSEQDSDRCDAGVTTLVPVDPFECAVGG